ncbi:MAG: SagB/ThcOx family dehydrogenase [Candidatus Omnitrophica bacterium]|nr:SagB/ThcOx family dehydrogenase [Candidatus Omnitrophota bacterium]
MKTKLVFKILSITVILFVYSTAIYAEDIKPVKLLSPQTDGGKPLMLALKERKSMREFASRELAPQALSDLLWAACGINRPDSGGRTAPTAKNMQEIDLYVVKAEGVYLYDARSNVLMPVLAGDMRALTGKQPFVKDAPVNLIFVADLSKMGGISVQDADFYAATDTGFISENVYLYCASTGLATVVRGWVDKAGLAKAMKLRPDQKIVLAQTVGYPKE